MNKRIIADLGDIPEDKRINAIGQAAEAGKSVAFIVEDNAKADRYIRKLTERFNVKVVERGNGPTSDTVWVKVARKQ